MDMQTTSNNDSKNTKKLKEDKKSIKANTSEQKKYRFGIIILIIGGAALFTGVGFLLFNLFKAPGIRDAEYLTNIGAWQREDEPSVVWNFTEIGKGKVTTNSHADEYDFIWAMEDNQLKVETSWLYTLNDEYTYKLNQSAKTLTLTSGESTYIFVPAEASVDVNLGTGSSIDTEVTEDN